MGVNVIRPDIAGLMGAYGAALYGKAHAGADARSTVLTEAELEAFDQKVNTVQCQGCGNHCQLTINVFADGKRFISGNRCDKPVTGKANNEDLDLYAYKLKLLEEYRNAPAPANARARIGIPLCLNMYELLPFWHTLFHQAGLCRGGQPLLQPQAVPERPGHHPQRYGLLPGQAEPRPYPLAVRAGRGRHFLPLHEL